MRIILPVEEDPTVWKHKENPHSKAQPLFPNFLYHDEMTFADETRVSNHFPRAAGTAGLILAVGDFFQTQHDNFDKLVLLQGPKDSDSEVFKTKSKRKKASDFRGILTNFIPLWWHAVAVEARRWCEHYSLRWNPTIGDLGLTAYL